MMASGGGKEGNGNDDTPEKRRLAEIAELDNEVTALQAEAEEWVKEHNTYADFFGLMKHLPDGAFLGEPLSKLPEVVEFMGQLLYGENVAALNQIRNDPVLALKIWGSMVDCTTRILKDAMDKKKVLANRPQVETHKMLEENSDAIRNSLAAITNFVAADVSAISTEAYCSIVHKLKDIWYEGALDSFISLPYSPLENLTTSRDRSIYLMESKSLSLGNLVDRTRKYPFDSPIYASLLRTIANLSQVPSVSKELLTSRLENETEVYFEHLLPAMKLQYPPSLRVSMSGLFKNLAMFPDSHSVLLDKDREFLSCALGPIVGTGEYSEDEMMNLPIALYGTLLSENVPRDPDEAVRCNTVEFIYQLCSIRSSREALRDQNVYCLMREYHKWEQDESLLDLIEQVVNILIQTEEEIGVEDFKALK